MGRGQGAGRTPVEGSEGTSVAAAWRCLTCVGESGPSVSEDESTLLSEASSLVDSMGMGKW